MTARSAGCAPRRGPYGEILMAFESLSDKLQNTFKKLRGKGVLTEADINDAMREVKLALLEADVNFKVVKEFVAEVKEKAMGQDVLSSLTPGQQVIKIVNDELVEMMGGTNSKLTYAPSGFTTLLMVGLQGTGKTTTCGKLAAYLKKNGKKPMLAACDIYRPAAIDQLEVVGKTVDVPVFTDRGNKVAEDIALKAKKEAERRGYDVLIVDTAGRLQIDQALMDELVRVKKAVKPHEILLVVDALTGQDAVNAAEGFNEALGIDGIIMTKMDGDSRGGAALSAKKVTGKPIKFIGVGEQIVITRPNLFGPRRKDGCAGAVPPGADGIAYPGHGRYAFLNRKGAGDLRRGEGSQARKETQKERVHAGGFPGSDGRSPEDGRHRQDARHDPGSGRGQDQRRRHRQGRKRIQADGGHHLFYDAGGAEKSVVAQCQQTQAYRCGQRTAGQQDQ